MHVHIMHESFRLSKPGGRWEVARAEVAVVGLGLIGGSIGLGLQDFSYAVGGWDSDPQAIEAAVHRGAINGLFEQLPEAAEADAIFIATPPEAVLPVLRELAPHLRPETVVTDCSSVKAEIVEAVNRELPDLAARFVGGHPMAGLHVGGVQNSSWNLFDGAAWVLTPLPSTDREAYSRISQIIHGLGAQIVLMDPVEHDRHVALLSHVPHVLAANLMQASLGLAFPTVAGGSWRDLTRVAGADPELWTQIVMGNRIAIAAALRDLSRDLDRVAEMAEEGDAEGIKWLFEAAREAKRRQENSR